MDGDIDFCDIFVGVLQGNTLASYLFIICPENVLQKSIYIKSTWFHAKKKKKEVDDIVQKLWQTQTAQMI